MRRYTETRVASAATNRRLNLSCGQSNHVSSQLFCIAYFVHSDLQQTQQ